MKISLPARINLALGLGVGLVLLVAWGSFSTINALIDDAQRVTRTQQTFILLEQLGHSLKSAESLHRKYLLTPDANALKDYGQARAVLVKARTSNAELLETIQRVLKSHVAHDNKDS